MDGRCHWTDGRGATKHPIVHRKAPDVSTDKAEKLSSTQKGLRKIYSQHYALTLSGIT